MAEIFNGILWRFTAFVLDCPYITFYCAVVLVITAVHRNGNGQTCCKGCLEKYNGNTIAARNWDCMLMDVFKDGENIGIYCSTCLHELMANEILNGGEK
jgi:hypothetical protein